MNTPRDHDTVIGAWLDDGPQTLPVETRQAITVGIRTITRRPATGWPLPRLRLPTIKPRRLSMALGSAAVVVVAAALVLNFYANQQGIGGDPSLTPPASPTVGPEATGTPPPSLLARGDFVIRDWGRVEFEATREGSSVTGRMAIGQGRGSGWPITVDLECTRTTGDGLIMIGGHITDGHLWPEGTLAAIVLKRGPLVKAHIWAGTFANMPATQTTDCVAYLDAWLTWSRNNWPGEKWLSRDIVGTAEFAPYVPPTDATPSASPTLSMPFGLTGNGVIALAKDGDILVADRPGGDLRALVAGPEDDRSPMFSPDGTRLAFLRDTGQGSFLMVADADGTNLVAIPLEPTDLEWWSFAPDSRSLMAVGSINDEFRVFIRPIDPAAPPTVLQVPLLGGAMLRSWAIPTFNPMNAQEILVVAQLEPDGPQGGGLYVYDLATGGIRTIVEPADEQYFQDIAWLPDGEHIIYTSGGPRIVAADGSGDQALDTLRGRFSPLSNDGIKIVAERGGEGEAAPQPVVVPINGDGEPVVLACGPGTDIECPAPPSYWIWSPDDSMLIGIVYHETSSSDQTPLAETYLLVDSSTGQVTELDWRDVGTPAWQRVAP